LAEKSFHKLLLRAVDSALSSLGDSARQSVYFHLEKRFNVARNEIPSRVEDFDRGLETMFGTGTRFLEVLIMRKLYEEIGAKRKILKLDGSAGFNFVAYVKAAEQACLESEEG
jgi:hypothetical protein